LAVGSSHDLTNLELLFVQSAQDTVSIIQRAFSLIRPDQPAGRYCHISLTHYSPRHRVKRVGEREVVDEDDKDASTGEYRPIICQACTRVHFINRKTGQLLGQKDSNG
jgi:hypothetical protein